ncbi:MAG: class I SAM-dependent methyltransferase [Nitrospinae bacterium]|nr:class I SAM-dependent methyltransferase [Nitrospinota bacterium]
MFNKMIGTIESAITGAREALDAHGAATQGDLVEHAAALMKMAAELVDLSNTAKYRAYKALLPDGVDGYKPYSTPYLAMIKDVENQVRLQNEEYGKYKYFFGQPYQAFATLGIFGARDTETRYREYGLGGMVSPHHRVLDIGASCGFMSIYTALMNGCRADCVEHNPYMVKIGEIVAGYLGLTGKMRFFATDVTGWEPDCRYDVVFSFASHHTDDGGHSPVLRDYMKRLWSLLVPGGALVFEGHCADYGNGVFYRDLEENRDLFSWSGSRRFPQSNRELFIMRRNG